jgi:iron complex outermembrane receptor protein
MVIRYFNLKNLLFLFLLILVNTTTKAQVTTGKISGLVQTADHQPAAHVTILLKEVNKVTMTNASGNYSFQNIKAGTYTLKVSLIGAKSEEKTIDVTAGKASIVDFSLTETASTLNEVTVNSRKNINNTVVTLGKAGISPLDLPQTTGVVSNQVIRDQQINRLGDALKNVSGISLTQTRQGVAETFSARGYSIGIAGAAGSMFKNGVISNTQGFPEASTLESIEVLKGSAALLYGNVSGGLIINMITKKPKFNWGGEVSMRYGSYNFYKPTVDLYGPIAKNLAFRVIGTYENAESFRDVVKTNRTYVNPSLLYNLGKNTTILVEGDYLKSDLTPDNGIGTLNNGREIPTNIRRSQFINTNWAYSNIDQFTGTLTLNHKFTDRWNLNFITSAQKTDVDSYGASVPNNVSANGDWNRTLSRAKTAEKDYTGQLNLIGKFNTGTLQHQLLVGSDVTRVINVTNAFVITSSNGVVGTAYDKINTIDLSDYTPRNDIPTADITTLTTAPVNRFGAYAQDLISITDKFKVLAGLRWSWQQTNQTNIYTLKTQVTTKGTAATKYDRAFTPKIALIYQPVKTSSVFATYASNFIVNTGTDLSGNSLRPSTVDQYEAGVKNELFCGKLSANFSVYRIVNSNLAITSPVDQNGNPNVNANFKTLSGQTTSDGFEADVTGNITKNFYFITGYGYNYARYTKTNTTVGSNIEGERLTNNPAHTVNASAFYTFDLAQLRGLKIGASAFYTGSRLAGANNTVGQTQQFNRLISLGGFTTVDLSAGYTYKKVSLLARISNIGNTLNYVVHDNYSVSPVAPRQFLTTLSYKF